MGIHRQFPYAEVLATGTVLAMVAVLATRSSQGGDSASAVGDSAHICSANEFSVGLLLD